MAESIGLIIGEYTIPSDLPVIYITDSNNTRPLKKYTAMSESHFLMSILILKIHRINHLGLTHSAKNVLSLYLMIE
jgi:hypothetical protein